MIIERITIGSFGNLHDVSFELGPRLNVVVGPNESGKSTVAAFIRYMLYGFGTHHTTGDMPEREKRVSWESSSAEGSMEIRLEDGRRFRIERTTTATAQAGRVGYREDSRMIDLADGSVTRFRSLPGTEFFSVPEQVYVNTAFFGQFSDSRINEGEMTQAMENLLFSGDERVSSLRALKTLRQAENSLSHRNGVGGAIYELTAQTDATRLRLTQAMRLNAQIHKCETELHKLSLKISAAERERDRLDEIDKNYRNYLTICSFDKLHEVENTFAELRTEQELLRRDNSYEGFLPDEEYLSSLVSTERVFEIARQNYVRTADKLSSIKAEAHITPEAEELLSRTDAEGGTDKIGAEYTRLHKHSRILHVASWTLAAVSLVALFLGIFLIRPLTLSPWTAMLGLSILAAGGFSGVFFRSRYRLTRSIASLCQRFDAASGADLLCKLKSVEHTREAMQEQRENIRRAEENTDISLKNLEMLRAELVALAAKWNKTLAQGTPGEMVESISVHARAYLAEERRLAEAIAEVRGKVMALREKLEGESEIAIRALVSPEKREAMKKINYKIIGEGLSYYRTTCENLHSQYRALLDELNGYRRNAENPAELRAELAVMEERVTLLRRRHRAYGIACDAISNASDSLRAEISPRLSSYASALLSGATGGRYDSLEVSNRLSMTYRTGDEVRPLPSMSGGTREITYIALRLALIDMLYEEKPPLCFDESLAHQDDERTKSILWMLDKVAAEGMQSILFTCHTREAALAGSVSNQTRCFDLKGEDILE